MRIIQVVPTLAYGDAIGNDALALEQVLKENGYSTDIFAGIVAPPMSPTAAKSIEDMVMDEADIAILHLSTGSPINRNFSNLSCRKIIRYHNVTPPEYYSNNNPYIEKTNKMALKDVAFLADKVDYCLAVSEFNKMDLMELGYKCVIDILPILIPFDDYKKKASELIIEKFKNLPTVLFTGRVVPNKKFEDIIRAFGMYKKNYNKDARLVLVGAYEKDDPYYRSLQMYVEKSNINDVFFTGHIRFDEILAYYKVADIFLCQSEHEGFCVPLVEAMFFQVPIVAYESTAIPDTLAGCGLLLNTKDPLIVAGAMNCVYTNKKVRDVLLANEKERLYDFSHEKVSKQFLRYISDFTNGGKTYEENCNY